jgi:hypothetical protein
MRRVVFVGNRQIEVLARLYRQFGDGERSGRAIYIAAHRQPSDDDWEALATADVIVEQLQDFKPKIDLSGLSGSAERIAVPLAIGGFLWPFAGQAHPGNPSLPYLPYPAEWGDAYLNRMISRGADPQATVAAYLALDVNDLVDLDRLYQRTLEKQRQRDAATGFSVAEIIAEHFRDEAVFLTPLHPNRRIALALADQLFRRLDIGAAERERMNRTSRATPFPKDELPIHPSVARHFGLRYIGEGHRFRLVNEGRFTFAEYALRYMEGRWNAALAEGLALAEGGDPAAARDRLRAGLAGPSRWNRKTPPTTRGSPPCCGTPAISPRPSGNAGRRSRSIPPMRGPPCFSSMCCGVRIARRKGSRSHVRWWKACPKTSMVWSLWPNS